MKITYKSIFISLSLAFYLFIVLGGQSIFSSTAGNDAETIRELDPSNVELGDSYAIMATIHNILPQDFLPIITYFIGSIFILYCYKGIKSKFNSLLIFLLLIIPIIFTISAFQKDLILVLFIIPVYLILISHIKISYKIMTISIIYCIYALVFRQYYYLITFLFLCIFFFKGSNNYIKIMLILLASSTFLLLPSNIYYELQSARDVVNEFRINTSISGNRTAFPNPLTPNSLYNFIYNYIYAITRLNFGFFFSFNIKDLIFMPYPFIYFYYLLLGYISKDKICQLASYLILSHFLVYSLFEPDAGSYARHFSSTLPYLSIIILYSFNNKLNKAKKNIKDTL